MNDIYRRLIHVEQQEEFIVFKSLKKDWQSPGCGFTTIKDKHIKFHIIDSLLSDINLILTMNTHQNQKFHHLTFCLVYCINK